MKSKKEYIKDLLIRLEDESLRPEAILPKGVKFQSDLTIAHDARIEIGKLSDEDFIPIFQEFLTIEKVTINRINLITYLIQLANKLKRNDIADYILSLVKTEKTRWINDVSLAGLNQSELKIEHEKDILFELAKHKDWQIRFNALGLLSKLPESYYERIEDFCLGQIKEYKSKHHSLRALALTLSKVGSSKSLPDLKEITLNTKKSNAILAAISAIHQINGKNELEFYLDCFGSKRDSMVKKRLIELICLTGNENQKELLIKRVKSLLSKNRTTNWHYTKGTEPELVTIIKFLDKFAIDDSNKLLNWINEKKSHLLDQTESFWINERIRKTLE